MTLLSLARRSSWAAIAGVWLALARPASAADGLLDAAPMHDKKIRIDGMLREWPERISLGQTVSVKGAKGDPKASVVLGYDGEALYVAMDVGDAQFVAKGDYAELKLAVPTAGGGFKSYSVKLEPGQPGKTSGAVTMGGAAVSGAQLIEAPTASGFTLEAKIPWTAFPEAATTRVGMRGAVVYHDADAGTTAVIATSKQSGSAMPALTIQAEYALNHALVFAKGLSSRPSKEAFGNLVGDKMRERVAVFDRYLTVTGYSYRGGTEFFYQDLQVQEPTRVKLLRLVDFNADGFDEVVVRRQLGTSGSGQDLLEVWQFANENGGPVLLFQHEVGLIRGDNEVMNDVDVVSFKGKPAIVVKPTKTSVDVKTWDGVPAGGETKPVLLPWQAVSSRTYAWKSKGFELVEEKSGKALIEGPPSKGSRFWSGSAPPPGYDQTAGSSAREPSESEEGGVGAAPKARPPTSEELMDQVYDLYRTERGAKKQKPRFDFVTNVAADETLERVVVHGKDIVVFGKRFLQSRSYAYTTIGVEKPEDVLQVTAADLTGDGRAEVIVSGVIRAQASKKLGGDMVTRHALFIYRIMESGVTRVFAAETGRSVGRNVVLQGVKFVPDGTGTQIELQPGRAHGWDQHTYPFPEDSAPYGGLEPLLLPWTDQGSRVYTFTDGKFVRR